MSAPLAFRWDGEAMAPLPRFTKEADARFVIGQVYRLDEIEERSGASHRHFFASVNEVWASLPEAMGDRFPTPTHLRKYALVKGGYRDERSVVCASRAEALRVAAFIRPIDEFAIVVVSGPTVTVYTAKSQSEKAMGRADFQASKTRVLEILSELVGVEVGQIPTDRAA